MRLRAPATVVIGAIAVVAVTGTFATVGWRASHATIDAGFWWDAGPFELSAGDTLKLGGPVTAEELRRIKERSRDEVHRAFGGLRINVTADRDAFWRVAVIGTPIALAPELVN